MRVSVGLECSQSDPNECDETICHIYRSGYLLLGNCLFTVTRAIHRTPAETKRHYTAHMGEELGGVFYALWQETYWLCNEWHEYVQLFGTKPSRIALMNEAAPQFFRIVRDELFDMITLRIARLTDSPKSAGRSNLTIQQLPARIREESFRGEVQDLIDAAITVAKYCRDRRNRRIAHRALDLSLGVPEKPLQTLTRENINAAVTGLSGVLNAVSLHYVDSTTDFGLVNNFGGTAALIYILDDGVQKKSERITGLARGELPVDTVHRLEL